MTYVIRREPAPCAGFTIVRLPDGKRHQRAFASRAKAMQVQQKLVQGLVRFEPFTEVRA